MTHTSTEQPEALPCPFCGGHSTLDSNGQDFRVFCWDCGAKSKAFDCWQKAEAAWNRRTTVSKAQRTPLQGLHILDVFFEANEGVVQGKYPDIEHGVLRETERAHGITQEKQGCGDTR